LVLRKIIKIVATRCHILKLKCTKFDFGWGSASDPAGGAYSTPPDPLGGFKGHTCKGREMRGEGRVGKGAKVREVRGGEEDFRAFPQFQIYHYTTGKQVESGNVTS